MTSCLPEDALAGIWSQEQRQEWTPGTLVHVITTAPTPALPRGSFLMERAFLFVKNAGSKQLLQTSEQNAWNAVILNDLSNFVLWDSVS